MNETTIEGQHLGGANQLIMAGRNDRHSSPVDPDGIEFLENIFQVILDEVIVNGCDDENKVVEFVQPERLEEIMNLKLQAEGCTNNADLIRICKHVIQYSVKTGHHMFFNQLYQGM